MSSAASGERRPQRALRASRFLRPGRAVRPGHPLPRQHRAGEQSFAAAKVNGLLSSSTTARGRTSTRSPCRVIWRSTSCSARSRRRRGRGSDSRLRESPDRPGGLERRARGGRADPLEPQPARSCRRPALDGQHARGLCAREQDRGVPRPYQAVRGIRAARDGGEKLMVLTHSTIETEGYASTTQNANALLAALGIERRAVTAPSSSPPPVNSGPPCSPSRRASAVGSRSPARRARAALTVLGCTGNGKGDHIRPPRADVGNRAGPPLVAGAGR